MYDCTNRESWNAVEKWIIDAKELTREDISIIVCGNKVDLKDLQVVSQEEAKQFCNENNVLFIETSAVTG